MNIAVLVKHVVDSTEVRFDKKTDELRLRGLPEKISDYDKHAIKAAVNLKEQFGAKVTAFSFGTKDSFKSLKEAVAMGADQGCLISYNKATQVVDSLLMAQILAKAIEHLGGFDFIICGSMTEDTTNKIIGPAVSAFLKLNHISNVTKLEVTDSGNVITTSEDNISSIRVESSLPIAISVNRTLNEPRLATKIQIMKVPMKKIKTISLADLSLPEDVSSMSSCELESLTPISKDRKQMIFSGEAEESVNNLMNELKGLI